MEEWDLATFEEFSREETLTLVRAILFLSVEKQKENPHLHPSPPDGNSETKEEAIARVQENKRKLIEALKDFNGRSMQDVVEYVLERFPELNTPPPALDPDFKPGKIIEPARVVTPNDAI